MNVLLILTDIRLEAQEQKEEPQRTVAMSTLEAKITPHFEFTLPSGNISERLEQQFNNLNTVFTLLHHGFDPRRGD